MLVNWQIAKPTDSMSPHDLLVGLEQENLSSNHHGGQLYACEAGVFLLSWLLSRDSVG